MQAAGLDGIEFESYRHLMDSFWSPATNQQDDDWGDRSTTGCVSCRR